MSEEIHVGDTTYVSSKRASDISGYAQDYIGQLARSGQIDAKRLGGLWYVTMPSLDSYRTRSEDLISRDKKPSVIPVTPQEKQDSTLSFDGKDFISANRASKLTGYNQDYIGQLARSGKVASHQIGNRWFIDQEGIRAHKKEKDSLLAAVQLESLGIQHDPDAGNATNQDSYRSHDQLLNYIKDEGDLMPQISPSDREYDAYTGMDDGHEVPIHVIKRTPPPQRRSYNPYPLRSEMMVSKRRSQSAFKSPLVIVMLLCIFAGSGAFLLSKFGCSGVQSTLSMSASAVATVSGNVFNEFATTFESLFEPEIVYQRPN